MAAGGCCFVTVAHADLSRAVSHALRHEPWLYELKLDEAGWAPIDQLLAALRESQEALAATRRRWQR
jgi:putative RNA 2'-phosphotransferase